MEHIIKILSSVQPFQFLSSEQKAAFEEGLKILESASKALDFVRDSRRFKDYNRRVRQLLTFLQTLDLTSAQTDGTFRRRVGRPSKEEQAAYAEAVKQKALQDAKNSIFPDVKPDFSVQTLAMNGLVVNPEGESYASAMPNLNQLRPFLSKDLQKAVNGVRELRNEMATKSEQAKMMVEANEKADRILYSVDDIAQLTKRAVAIESEILPSLYKAIDRELGECYLRLDSRVGDPDYIEYVKQRFGGDAKELRTIFRPFYDKAQKRDPLFAQAVANKIAEDRPEVKAARDAAAKHKAEADALIKYILRKDKPSTKMRIKGLTQRIDKLRQQYSDIVSEEEIQGFEAVLAKTIEEAGV